MEFNCNLCNYKTTNYNYYWNHSKSNTHINNENKNLQCIKCNKFFKTLKSLTTHRYNFHNKIYKITKNNNMIIKIKDNTEVIKENVGEVKTTVGEVKTEVGEVKTEIGEVKITVNRAINKASALIKYLMENHSNVPSIKKISDKQCEDRMRIDFECPYNDENKYLLQKNIILHHHNNTLINILYKSILNLVNHKKLDKQQIYNTDATRHNYVIKTSKWNEDNAGLKFTDYIIRPLLKTIDNLILDYGINELNTFKPRKHDMAENEKHYEQVSRTFRIQSDLHSDKLIKPLLNKLTPYLRYLEEELEELEKYDEIKKIQQELEDIIYEENNSDSEEEVKPKKKNK